MLKMLELLNDNGYEAYYVGGHVRDELLGKSSFDIDITTNAPYDEIVSIMSKYYQDINKVGKTFGVLIVDGIEIAQFRSKVYNKYSKPDVVFTSSIKVDSSRRDFTVNAIYKDKDGKIVDPQGGIKDIIKKKVRAVGNPDIRFEEDPSRLLRALYLAAKLDFEIDKLTSVSIRNNVYLLEKVPNELKGKIICKSIKAGNFHTFMKLVMDYGMMDYVFPELSHLQNLEQNDTYHHLDAWNHTLEVVRYAERYSFSEISFVLGALFHDNAKGLPGVRGVNKIGKPSDLGHEEAGVDRTIQAIQRVGIGKEIANNSSFYVKHHGIRLGIEAKDKSIVKWLRKLSKEFNSKKELSTKTNKLIGFIMCDAQGFGDELREKVYEMAKELRPRAQQLLESNIFYPNELPVTGLDIVKAGGKGKLVGEILDELVLLNVKDREHTLNIIDKRS